MSDNPFRLEVTFNDESSAEHVAAILRAGKQWIWAGDGEQRFLGQHITNVGETEGINFTSFWVPNEIEVNGNLLTFEFVGSPGDDWPDDVVVWFGKKNARRAKGTIHLSQTGDIIEIDETF